MMRPLRLALALILVVPYCLARFAVDLVRDHWEGDGMNRKPGMTTTPARVVAWTVAALLDLAAIVILVRVDPRLVMAVALWLVGGAVWRGLIEHEPRPRVAEPTTTDIKISVQPGDAAAFYQVMRRHVSRQRPLS
jgi:hypothetical protein